MSDRLASRSMLEILRAAYQEESIDTWLGRILPLLTGLMPGTVAAGFYEFSTQEVAGGLRLKIDRNLRVHGESVLEPGALPALESAPPAMIASMFRRTEANLASANAPPGMAISDMPEWRAMWRSVKDGLGLVARDVAGNGILFFTGMSEQDALSSSERALLTKLTIHLGSAHRLLAIDGRLGAADAVLTPEGSLLHASEAVQATREPLQEGIARRAEALRSVDDAERALEIWRGLIAGRWSLVDHLDTDGKRFLLVMKNRPRAIAPDALTPRERRVCALAAHGHGDKAIAYILGLTVPAVGAALHRARRKLGVRTRVDMAREWKRAVAADAGETTAAT